MKTKLPITVPKQWLHIGHNRIEPQKFDTIRNIPLSNKPIGGLWASPLQLDTHYRSEWHEFSVNVWGKMKHPYGTVFSIKKTARIFIIDSQEDLINLFTEIGEAENPYVHLLPKDYLFLDFEKASQRYDVLFLSNKGQARTRRPLYKEEYNLYGWDSECCLIMNPDVIQRQLPIKLK